MPQVEREGASLYYEVHGSGPAIVLAHGAGGNAMSWWQQVPAFTAAHTTITFDHRAFGRSRCEDAAFHPKHFGGDLLAMLDAEGIERAALVCQSMGGWTGVRATLDAPDRVACLVLAGTPGGIVTPKVIEAVAGIARGIDEAAGIRGNAALAADFPAREPARAFLYDQINALNTGLDPRWLSRMFDEEGRIEPSRLAGWSTPTLFLSGSADRLFPPASIREAAALVPGAELADLPGLGHSSYFEAPELFNERVLAFVAQHLG
jgi:pimeloyl-ACP methyl ester carboxylesterase